MRDSPFSDPTYLYVFLPPAKSSSSSLSLLSPPEPAFVRREFNFPPTLAKYLVGTETLADVWEREKGKGRRDEGLRSSKTASAAGLVK